jgi:hypothetical protein
VKEIQVGFEKNLPLDMGQWLSIPLIVAGFVLLISLYRKGLTVEPQPEPAAEAKPVSVNKVSGGNKADNAKQRHAKNKRR